MAQEKSFTLDGKRYRLDSKVPAADIRWLINRVHVSTPDSEIESDIRNRASANNWPANLLLQAVRYALACHRRNQSLYSNSRF